MKRSEVDGQVVTVEAKVRLKIGGVSMSTAYAIIIAGGNGERFWPLSTPARPKQFVSLFGGKPLIRHAADRLEGLIPPERTLVITAKRLVAQTRKALPRVPRQNIVGEPCRRDTAAAVACACGLVKRLGGPDAVGCILTADQLMEPVAKFRRALRDAIAIAARTDAVVTMGIVPTWAATGFGYIEAGARVDFKAKTTFRKALRFVEKPDEKKAKRFLSSKRYYWNSGMFIWKASTMERAFLESAPDIAGLIRVVETARSLPSALARAYPPLRAISVDYAVMERIRNILVARSEFEWDDVGSWLAIPNHFPSDKAGNACLGRVALFGTSKSVVVSDDRHITAVVGLDDVVVVHTAKATLVCAKNRVQDVKTLVRSL